MLSILYIPVEIVDYQDTDLQTQIMTSTYRHVFSACLALMILVTLSTPADVSIPWNYPSKYFRAFFSSPIWLPIATLSYSIYLWHYLFILLLGDTDFFGGNDEITKE